jgi:uncharacterized protein
VTEPHTMTPLLTDVQRRALLDLARAAVEAQVRGSTPPGLPSIGLPDATGTFVTVRMHGELRGCLGTLQCVDGLAGDVARCAADAASTDPRFLPVTLEELEGLGIDISVLGPLEPIDPRIPGAVIVGRHGLVVEKGRHRGLLLPQVATEWGWSADQFLVQTCLKAGLAPDAWQRGAHVYRFEADVFGE